MPGATFFGANNPKSGYMGGVYLGQAAIKKFGADKVKEGYFILGDLPQSGAVPAMRTGGQLAGFLAAVDGFPEDHVITIDTKNTLEESFAQTNNVLGRIPEGVPIMTTAINDQATTGTIRAVKQAGREADLIAVGMGADELATMMAEPTFVASVGYFPERYGNFLIPMALAELSGHRAAADRADDPRDGRQGQHLQLLPGLPLRPGPRHGGRLPAGQVRRASRRDPRVARHGRLGRSHPDGVGGRAPRGTRLRAAVSG